MGNANSRPVLPDSRALFSSDLPKFVMQNKFGKHGMLGDGKFMKSYLMRVDGTNVVVKVYMKLNDEDLSIFQKRLHQIWIVLSPSKYPNLLPYQMWIKSQTTYARQKIPMTPIYLIRQYMTSNLYDRLLTRPFLTTIEKLWLIFQLFQCLEIAHSQDVIHGDIKPENVLCTGWNFVILTDFSPYKPTHIASDDPTDFKYFFDSSGKRSCYVAPERFAPRDHLENFSGRNQSDNVGVNKNLRDESRNSSNTQRQKDLNGLAPLGGLTFAMDVFSLGCTIAEVLLDSSSALFDLPTMLSYIVNKDGTSSHENILNLDGQVKSVLSRIDNPRLRDVIVHMTQKDPRKRLQVDEYKYILQGMQDSGCIATQTSDAWNVDPLFPPYFEKMLLPIFFRLHYEGITPDRRIHILCESYKDLVYQISGIEDLKSHDTFQNILNSTFESSELNLHQQRTSSISRRGVDEASAIKNRNFYQEQAKKNRQRYIKSSLLLCPLPVSGLTSEKGGHEGTDNDAGRAVNRATGEDAFIMQCGDFLRDISNSSVSQALDKDSDHVSADELGDDDSSAEPYAEFFRRPVHNDVNKNHHSGFVIIVQIIAANLRHLQSPQTRVVSILLLLRFASMSDDEVILKRILPSLLNATEDAQNAHVCAVAVRSVAAVLSMVSKTGSVDEEFFPIYIVPAMNRVLRVNDKLVRITFAATIGTLAENGKTFLERAHFDAQKKTMAHSEGNRTETDIAPAPSGSVVSASPPSSLTTTLPGTESSLLNSRRDESLLTMVNFQYTKRLHDLRESVAHWVKVIFSDLPSHEETRKGSGLSSSGTLIKRELLNDIERLCVFFGEDMVVNILLPHLLTFFSDHDWELRLAFWRHIPTVCAFVGATLTQAYVLPGIDHGLVDYEECVVVETVRCLHILCEMQLLTVPVLMTYLDASKASALLLHPSKPIREETILLLSNASRLMGPVDTFAVLIPVIEGFFQRGAFAGKADGVITPDILRKFVREPLDQIAFRSSIISRHQALLEKRPMMTDIASESQSIGSISESADRAPQNSFQQCNERSREDTVSLMTPYMEHAAIELHTKITQWRHALHGSLYTSPFAATLRRCTSTSNNFSSAGTLDALLNLSANAQFSTKSLNTLMVPHQKYGVGFYYPLTEEQRHMFTKLSDIRDPDAICALYGIGSNRYEAEKVLTWAERDGLVSEDENTNISLLPKPAVRGHTDTVRTGSEGNGGPTIADFGHHPDIVSKAKGRRSFLMKKRIRALGIPPLPPDVGSLLQPSLTEDRRLQFYNGYIESLSLPLNIGSNESASIGAGPTVNASGGGFLMPRSSMSWVNEGVGEGSINAGGTRDVMPIGRTPWRPKESTLICTLREHTGSANRIAVSPDQSFFGSASSDGTVKIWQLRGIDSSSSPRSSLTYKRHHSPVTDITIIENSHSMASCSADGTIHVWRVDVDGKVQLSTSYADDGSGGGIGGLELSRSPGLGVVGMGLLKVISPHEGSVQAIEHFNSDVASVLSYVTSDGGVHGWDLRSSGDAFFFNVRPELGSSTAMTVAPDRSYIIVGTSRGYILLWDLRYNVPCKLWRHSSGGPIHRLASCKSLQQAINNTQYPTSSPALADTEGCYLYIAAGLNEVAIFGLPEAGECLKCFRSIPLSNSREPIGALPYLEEVPLPRSPDAFISSIPPSIRSASTDSRFWPQRQCGVHAMVGRTPLYMVTAGSDSMVRYWDFISPSKCFTISGLMPGQPRSIYEAPTEENMLGRLFLSFDSSIPSADTALPQHLPLQSGRGPIVPNNAFKDAVLDLKSVDLPTRSLIASAKNGTIKLWK